MHRTPFPVRPFVMATATLCLMASWSALGADQEAQVKQSQQQSAAEQTLKRHPVREQMARDWGISPQEYERYESLMQGPRGIYSPGLDPLTALGIEARSDEERRRYAELQVQAERRRIDKELAYQRAYDEANARLYPGEKVIQITSSPIGSAAGGKATLQMHGSGRLAVFVKDDCPACIVQVQQLQSKKRPFDLYFIGSQGDDDRIRRWAILAGIEPANVKNRQITLNHDQGRWLGLGLGGDLPATVQQVNGQWQRQ